ncbi:hypothetical protein S7711_02858 [Stachybotrys chartarum IBT 7711]|uniref:Rhodopsin domain-containing protein n=1 Tax=Stachybotrys chartarum (strain CBS 109288 / IBT 7711) TaxID=1280523 RepID=A0A084AH79_STACB|nr:hypothetical protein S7711_02858 [Stachybotrys chartarum IBT 7711]KFA56218.1 hypothetical protein S40293_00100 [Stachybotrys chartarum IBT 40293]KFA71408.1 hypothetical protein S40288_04278 [Stachybotrys chartarum IBT 40288]
MSNSSIVSNPNGSPPDFETLSSLQAVTYTLCVILTSIAFTVVLLRLWTNYRKLTKLTFDDSDICLAYTNRSAASTARHAWDVPRSAIDASWIQRGAILSTIWGPAMWFAKTAILTMYARIFSPLAWMQLCCYFAMGFLFCAFWSLVPLSVLYNFPHKGEQWDLPMMIGGMWTHLPFAIVGLISVLADVLIVVLPLPTLLRLQMSWKRRLGLSLMFLTAAICIVSGCVVFYLRIVLWRNRDADLTWNFAACWLTLAQRCGHN